MNIALTEQTNGQPVTLELEQSTLWLLGDDKGAMGYNRLSVLLYDFGGQDRTRRPSSTDKVTFEDLGRMSCLGASLRYDRAHVLMLESRDRSAPWPIHPLPGIDTFEGNDNEFVEHIDVQAAWKLIQFFHEMDGVGLGTASKLLHLKWPTFYPIADRKFRHAYGRMAAGHHNRCAMISGSRQRTNADIRAYWLAFRADLHRNKESLQELRDRLMEYVDDDEGHEHALRLVALDDLRLLDMLAWGVGDGRLR